jgi:hypothetical protein
MPPNERTVVNYEEEELELKKELKKKSQRAPPDAEEFKFEEVLELILDDFSNNLAMESLSFPLDFCDEMNEMRGGGGMRGVEFKLRLKSSFTITGPERKGGARTEAWPPNTTGGPREASSQNTTGGPREALSNEKSTQTDPTVATQVTISQLDVDKLNFANKNDVEILIEKAKNEVIALLKLNQKNTDKSPKNVKEVIKIIETETETETETEPSKSKIRKIFGIVINFVQIAFSGVKIAMPFIVYMAKFLWSIFLFIFKLICSHYGFAFESLAKLWEKLKEDGCKKMLKAAKKMISDEIGKLPGLVSSLTPQEEEQTPQEEEQTPQQQPTPPQQPTQRPATLSETSSVNIGKQWNMFNINQANSDAKANSVANSFFATLGQKLPGALNTALGAAVIASLSAAINTRMPGGVRANLIAAQGGGCISHRKKPSLKTRKRINRTNSTNRTKTTKKNRKKIRVLKKKAKSKKGSKQSMSRRKTIKK